MAMATLLCFGRSRVVFAGFSRYANLTSRNRLPADFSFRCTSCCKLRNVRTPVINKVVYIMMNSRIVRRDYRRTTSASQLISELGLQSLAERRKTSRLTLLYKAINGLVAIPMDELEHTSRCTRHCGLWTGRINILQSRVDAYKFSFFPRTVSDWNSLPSSAKSTLSVNSFKTALHRLSGVTNSHH